MNVVDQFVHAELALAAYALNLSPALSGIAYRKALSNAGMSADQADNFANKWVVLDQFTDSASGASAWPG